MYIITVNKAKEDRRFGTNNGATVYPFVSDAPDFDRPIDEITFRGVTTVMVDERYLARALEQFTKDWADTDVYVYQLIDVAYRVSGDMQKKEVTKNGVLPL